MFKSRILKLPSGKHSSRIQMIPDPPSFKERRYLCRIVIVNYHRLSTCNHPTVHPFFCFMVGIQNRIGNFLKCVTKSILCVILPKSSDFLFLFSPTNGFPRARNTGFHLVVRIRSMLFNLWAATYWISMIGTVLYTTYLDYYEWWEYTLRGGSDLGRKLPQQERAEAIFRRAYSPEESVFSDHKVLIQVSCVCTPAWAKYSPWIITSDEIEYTVPGNTLVESSGYQWITSEYLLTDDSNRYLWPEL